MIWIAKRIAVALVLVWIVATIVFLAIQMVPGDPAEMLLSQGGVAPDPAIVEELRTQLGLDRPFSSSTGTACGASCTAISGCRSSTATRSASSSRSACRALSS